MITKHYNIPGDIQQITFVYLGDPVRRQEVRLEVCLEKKKKDTVFLGGNIEEKPPKIGIGSGGGIPGVCEAWKTQNLPETTIVRLGATTHGTNEV